MNFVGAMTVPVAATALLIRGAFFIACNADQPSFSRTPDQLWMHHDLLPLTALYLWSSYFDAVTIALMVSRSFRFLDANLNVSLIGTVVREVSAMALNVGIIIVALYTALMLLGQIAFGTLAHGSYGSSDAIFSSFISLTSGLLPSESEGIGGSWLFGFRIFNIGCLLVFCLVVKNFMLALVLRAFKINNINVRELS